MKESLIVEVFSLDNKGNKIAGYPPKVIDSNINFKGGGRIIYYTVMKMCA